jgi:hypothetical protein
MGFYREDRLALKGELVLTFSGGAEDDDRILIGSFDLHDLIASQFCTEWENRVSLGSFRVLIERVP